jgi:hypothetical protein
MPSSVGISVTSTLYLAYSLTIATQQLDAKLILTVMGYMVRFTKPPVIDGNT